MSHSSSTSSSSASPPKRKTYCQTAYHGGSLDTVTHPKDRPIIPKGGLAPAPTGRKKGSSTTVDNEMGNATTVGARGSTRMTPPQKPNSGFAGLGAGANIAGVGAGGSKWAGRLRERMKIDS